METRQVRYFLAVARFGSFSAAAERIGVAQPALSIQVSKLESELGCHLFVRHARGIELTRAGEEFRTHANEIWERIESAKRETRLAARQNISELTFGIPTLMSTLLIAPLMEAMGSKFPGITLRVREGMGAALRAMFSAGDLDLAILYRVPGEEFPNAIPLFEEDFYLGRVSRNGGTPQQAYSADQLASVPLILSSPGNSHRDQLDLFARERGMRLKIVAEVDSITGQRDLVLKGTGATILPKSGFASWPQDHLHLARIREDGLISQALMVRSHEPRNARVLTLIQNLVKQLTDELIDRGDWPGARACA